MGTDRPNVSILAIASAAPTEWQQGLIGWLTLQVDEILVLDGIALRQAWDGRMVLSYPARRDRRGSSRGRLDNRSSR